MCINMYIKKYINSNKKNKFSPNIVPSKYKLFTVYTR